MKKIVSTISKVRFQDCDPFSHLNNSRYLDYFINAREDQIMENYDLNIFDIAKKKGLGWVIGSNQIAYLKPALIMETIIIDSQLISITPRSLKVEMRMWNEKQTQLKSILWTNFIHFDLKTQKSITHSEEFSELFNDILLPVEQNSFDERWTYLSVNQVLAH